MLNEKSLLIEGLLIPLVFILMLLIELSWSNRQVVKSNIFANVFHFLGTLLFLLTGYISSIFTHNLSLIFVIQGSIFVLFTTLQLYDVTLNYKKILLFSIIFNTVLFTLLSLFDSVEIRYILVSIGLSILFLYGIALLIVKTINKQRKLLSLFIWELLFIAILSLFRFTLNGHTIFTSLYIILYSLFFLLWNFSVLLKRNSIYRFTIEKNSEDIRQIQEDLNILNNVFSESSIDCSQDELYKNIFDLIGERFYTQKSVLFVLDDNDKLNISYSVGFSKEDIDTLLSFSCGKELIYNSFSNMVISEVLTGAIEDGAFKSLLFNNNLIGGACFPLYTASSRVGVLFVGITPRSTIINSDKEIFSSICRQISGVISGVLLHNKLKTMASIDHLTGIYNRREFFKQFRGEFNSTLRHKDSFTLFMVDIDDFKSVNDNYGHDVGDMVLIKVAQLIKHQLRSNDLFARYGGEEFIGVLLRSDKDGASNKLNRIINKVSRIRIVKYPDIKITISIGSCCYHHQYENIESIVKRADISLYKAKKAGKNRLCAE